MDIQVSQDCPQCGAPVTLSEDDRLLTCEFCGVKNFLQANGTFHYTLPDKVEPDDRRHRIYAPYIRLKSNLFQVTERGIDYKIIDTTLLGLVMPGLPPSLGLRPQAMKIKRLTPETEGSFLRMSVQAKVILEKAVQLSRLSGKVGEQLLHRSYIGDAVSLIYLPLRADDTRLLDAVTDTPLIPLEKVTEKQLKGTKFNPRWKVNFLPTLCPRCGWDLEGEKDCLVPTCNNCETAWELGKQGLQRVDWEFQPAEKSTAIHLPFWKITARIPAMDITSFADFVVRTNQPMVPRSQWDDREMQFWIPAFKLRPKRFLQIARQVTVNHWRLELKQGRKLSNLYPANLPASEGKQAIKIVLAASATSPKKIFPFLPQAKVKNTGIALVHLPFQDKMHDWYQPHTGTVVAKSVLRFGRNL